MQNKPIELYTDTYNSKPDFSGFVPYRICPLGAHVDHNLGRITGFAVDKGTHIVYSPDASGTVNVISAQFNKKKQWSLSDIPEKKQNDWADHLRGVCIALSEQYNLKTGLTAAINGELPIGGLSSSASVILAFLKALCAVNNIILSNEQLINISRASENNYVGVACGKLDQSCEVYCRKDSLLYMDMKDDSFELIPESPEMKPYKIAVFFSGLERSLASSKYNLRVDEARAAAYSLLAYAGLDYGKVGETNLRDVPPDVFSSYKDRLPVPFAKRAEHWFTENERVEKGVEFWKNGDIESFGRLVAESGKSSILNWEAGSPELITLHNIINETDGVYGGRFSGAGFKGSAAAIIDPDKAEAVLENVRRKYTKAFPALDEKYSACICSSADGAGI